MLTIDEKEYLKRKFSFLNSDCDIILFGTEEEKKIVIEIEKAKEKVMLQEDIARLQEKLKEY